MTVNRTLKNSSIKSFMLLLYHTPVLFTIYNLQFGDQNYLTNLFMYGKL